MLRRTDEKSRWREATKIFVLICRKIGYVFISNFNRILTFTEFFFILCRRTEHIVFFECMKSNIKSRINISNIEKTRHFIFYKIGRDLYHQDKRIQRTCVEKQRISLLSRQRWDDASCCCMLCLFHAGTGLIWGSTQCDEHVLYLHCSSILYKIAQVSSIQSKRLLMTL